MKGCKSRRKSRKRNVRKNKGGKKKRHIITRKKKRKRRRTKKRKRGGVKTKKSAFTKKSGLLHPNRGVIKQQQHRRLKELKQRLKRSPTIKNLQQPKNFKPIAKKTEEQSKMDEDSDSDSELSNIFGNMKTPTVGERSQNTEKMFSSKIETPKPK